MNIIKQFNKEKPTAILPNRTQVNINITEVTKTIEDVEVAGYEYDTVTLEDGNRYGDKDLVILANLYYYKQYLSDTDFKMTADYDQDTTEVKALREKAREYIRDNS